MQSGPVHDNAPKLGNMQVTRGWLLRVAGSVVILGGLLWYLPTDEVVRGFAAVGPVLFLVVLIAFVAGHAVAAFKWLGLLDFGFPYGRAARAHFAGLAANLCLPGVAGGDVVRAGLVAREKPLAELTAGSVADRLVDMLALALLSVAGVIMLQDATHIGLAVQLCLLLVFAVVCAFYLGPVAINMLLARAPGIPARGLLEKMANGFGDLGRRPLKLVLALVLSIAIQAGFIMLTVMLANAVGLSIPIGAWFFAWPVAKIIAVLPISLGGIGVREASLSALLVPFGANAALVVAASLIWQAVLISAGILGALAWMLSKPTVPRGMECQE